MNCLIGTYVTGTCSDTYGCLNSSIINGIVTCIGCDISLHFQFNSSNSKCVCQSGYVMKNNSCYYVCGNNLIQVV